MSCCPHSAPAFCGEWGFQPRWLPLNKNKTKQQNTTISTVVLGGKYRRSLDPRLVRTNDWEHHGQHYGYSVTVEVCLVCSMTCGQPLDNSPWCGDVMWRCKNGCYSSEINRPHHDYEHRMGHCPDVDSLRPRLLGLLGSGRRWRRWWCCGGQCPLIYVGENDGRLTHLNLG